MKPAPSTINQLNPHNNRIVLVLQGGGALGAYQAGVIHALHEHQLAPDWVVGTSIGAINAALVAGNPPAQRIAKLKAFWDRVSDSDNYDMSKVPDAARRYNIWWSTVEAVTRGVRGFFAPRTQSLFSLGLKVPAEQASFYDTSPLAATLAELIDFDYLNHADGMRLSVNALRVTSGELVSFDSKKHRIGIEHIMASGALPPGFAPIRIDGELYWDGGLYSNTPLETVLEDQPAVDSLCFMVDLWQSEGPEPTTLDEVQTRQKDVMYASRSKSHIADYQAMHALQHTVRELYAQLTPEAQARFDPTLLSALGCDSTLHVVRIPYRGTDWHMASKDINFSKGSIEWRWDQGYQDATRAIEQAGWLADVAEDTPLVVHELAPLERHTAAIS